MRNMEGGKAWHAVINQGAEAIDLKTAETGKQIIVTSYVISTGGANGSTITFADETGNRNLPQDESL